MKDRPFFRLFHLPVALFLFIVLAPTISFAQNDVCTSAPTIASAPTCASPVAGSLLAAAGYTAIGGGTGCSASTNDDVWFTFIAQSTNPTVTYTAGTLVNGRIQLFGGNCTTMTDKGCGQAGTPIAATGLTIGASYWVRIYSTNSANTGTFTICITDPAPANDLCANSILLTSGTTCSNVQGNMVNATLSASPPAACAGTVSADVWYHFVAQSTNPTISLSSPGSGFTNRYVQLLTGACGTGSLVCSAVNSNLAATGLTIGSTYYIRVSTIAASAPTANGSFNICITDPAPANDLCANSILLTSASTCAGVIGNMVGSTLSASPPAACSGTVSGDVWYHFVAQTTNPTIDLSSIGSGFTNRYIQLLTGACGTGSLLCSAVNTDLVASGLTIGNTYYIRISTIAGSVPSANGSFTICVTDPAPTNDNCSSAITLSTSTTCNNTGGTMYGATATAGMNTFCTVAGTANDVWYQFTAASAFPTIKLSSMGSNLDNAPNVQIFNTNSCTIGTLNSNSNNCASGTNTATLNLTPATALTVGTTYLVRIYSVTAMTNTGSTWNFNICIQDLTPPTNDDCSGATNLTPGTTCSNTGGTLYAATPTSGISAFCGTTGSNDVWYKFTANSMYPWINLSSMASAMDDNPRVQIFSTNSCVIATINANSNNCVSGTNVTSLNLVPVTALTVGQQYLVRVFSTSAMTNTSGNWTFNICVVDPPANDDCTGAITLTSGTTCSNTGGTMLWSTPDASVPGSCGNAAAGDVWYKYTATAVYPIITLSSVGSAFSTASQRIQLLSGTCGSWTSLICQTGNTLNTQSIPGGAGLTIGQTYYIRLTYNASTLPTSSTWTFNICITEPLAGRVDYSKSYVNITKGLNGGTIDPGDVLEIRATFAIMSKGADSLAFYDTLFHNKGFRLVPGSITLRTNEGKQYGLGFTDTYDNDAGWAIANGLDTVIQINLGPNANAFQRGKLRNTSKPSFYNSNCIVMATYRVTVYAGYNTKINYRGGAITFRDTATAAYTKVNFIPDSLIVYQSPGLCPNAISSLNAVGVESNGTFGVPSTGAPLARNRGTTAYTPTYVYAPFQSGNPQGPQDYLYGIANNTSAAYSTSNTWGKPDPSGTSHRVFTLWDIIGDHTGAANTARGNPPCDTTQPVSATNPCGYMLVINSSYKTDTAFQYTVSNLCPNTYYEIAAWMRNICYRCGCDSNGNGSGSGGYIPLAAGDSSGVQPNLAFQVDGTDYYTTGNIPYYATGAGYTASGSDTMNRWVKRGFTYRTNSSQTSFTLTLRNNAPGGGGNDWALDDINVATCLPNMSYSPSLTPTICDSNTLTIYDTVRSYFNNYNYYKWQRSQNGGSSWSDITAAFGPISTSYTGSAYQFISSYTIPPSQTTLLDSGDLYRLIVATSTPNLSNSDCQFTDGISIIALDVINCYNPLKIDLLSFNGKVVNDHSHLAWVTSREDESVTFEVEKSIDGTNFTRIGIVYGGNNPSAEINQYSFIDPDDFKGKAWYRIGISNTANRKKYSQVILITKAQLNFGVGNIINPFKSELSFEVTTNTPAKIDVSLTDMYGKIYKTTSYSVFAGVNSLSLKALDALPSGMYILQLKNKETVINNMVLKKN